MRELQVFRAAKGLGDVVVRRLVFSADSSELVAWVTWGSDEIALHTYDLRADTARALFQDELWLEAIDYLDDAPNVLLSPDRRFVVYAYHFEHEAAVHFEDVSRPNGEREWFPELPTDSSSNLGLAFTADGKGLLAVRNSGNAGIAPDVARLDMAVLTAPPKRVEERLHPLTRKPYQYPVRDLKWKRVMELPEASTVVVALSADGRLLAFATKEGKIHVADLKKKNVVASFEKISRLVRDRFIKRIEFDPAGAWVASLANGRVCARPLGAGKMWRTPEALGRANDFAYHPHGRVLCVVFEDGQARFLDPHTGAVRQSFKWAKKPKQLHSVAFAPDGLTCAVGTENGKVIVWDVDA